MNKKQKNRISSNPTFKQFAIQFIRFVLQKEYCGTCGQELTEIRGRYPGDPKRKVCACCATEKLEMIEDQKNIETYQNKKATP